MVATTDQKARVFDLITGVSELVRDGKRDPDEICDILQIIKECRDFAFVLGRNKQVLVPEFKVWKTIKLGTGPKTSDDFRKALKDGGFHIGDWASDILGKPAFTVATEETEVDLVGISIADLGFKNRAKRSEIYKRVLELGLELCPAEVGPQLRLQYKDQPMGEWVLIGMDPIIDSDGDLLVFGVGHNDLGLWLIGDHGNPDDVWVPGSLWVFVLPRK